jgi:hypothetical protein
MRKPRGARYATATPLERQRARRLRDRWARRYRPTAIDLLIVGEAPPETLDRYFYFPKVKTQDALFQNVVRAVLRIEPNRGTKHELLGQLRDAGVFLIDVSLEPLNERPLAPHIAGLIRRARRLKPRRIVLAKANVHDDVFAPLEAAGLPVVAARLRFPVRGRQAEFVAGLRRARRERRRNSS